MYRLAARKKQNELMIRYHPDDFASTLAGADRVTPSRVLGACHPLAEVAAAFQAARQVPGKTWIQVKD